MITRLKETFVRGSKVIYMGHTTPFVADYRRHKATLLELQGGCREHGLCHQLFTNRSTPLYHVRRYSVCLHGSLEDHGSDNLTPLVHLGTSAGEVARAHSGDLGRQGSSAGRLVVQADHLSCYINIPIKTPTVIPPVEPSIETIKISSHVTNHQNTKQHTIRHSPAAPQNRRLRRRFQSTSISQTICRHTPIPMIFLEMRIIELRRYQLSRISLTAWNWKQRLASSTATLSILMSFDWRWSQ